MIRSASLAWLVYFCAAVVAEDAAVSPDRRAIDHPLSNIGPAIGARLPGFSLPDQQGVKRDFEALRGPNGAVLYFYRSAEWCIYCQTQLLEVNRSLDQLRSKGYGAAGISFDSTQVLGRFSRENGIRLPLLSDVDSELIRRLALLDATVLPGAAGYGVPYHGSLIVDHEGVVIEKRFDVTPTLSHSTGVVVTRLFGSPLGTHETVATLDRLSLSYYASASSVSPGGEIDLFLEFRPDAGFHLYAPGAKSVSAVGWELPAVPGIEIGSVAYPPATSHIRSVGDHTEIPSYAGPVRLTRRVRFDRDAKLTPDAQGNIELRGTLVYQACNATTCYAPDTLPITWRLPLASGLAVAR